MRSRRSSILYQAPGLVLGLAAALAATVYSAGDFVPSATSVAGSSCKIKGNISPNTGEKIYHVPDQEHYAETRISADKGEFWFCSEAEAKAAGWRKARA